MPVTLLENVEKAIVCMDYSAKDYAVLGDITRVCLPGLVQCEGVLISTWFLAKSNWTGIRRLWATMPTIAKPGRNRHICQRDRTHHWSLCRTMGVFVQDVPINRIILPPSDHCARYKAMVYIPQGFHWRYGNDWCFWCLFGTQCQRRHQAYLCWARENILSRSRALRR